MAHILLIDDVPEIVTLVRIILEPLGHNISSAANGQEGLALLEQLTPDLIITNLHMPLVDGFAVLQTVRTDIRLQHIPVVMMTADSGSGTRTTAYESGATAFLAKPFRRNDILSVLDNLPQTRNGSAA